MFKGIPGAAFDQIRNPRRGHMDREWPRARGRLHELRRFLSMVKRIRGLLMPGNRWRLAALFSEKVSLKRSLRTPQRLLKNLSTL
ncbi:MAG: hypothetical protein DMG13_15215 [Acidobacteria bacterium]|nr:MAG: hypothetical protein DMG13_15215 [Acidobacteriota bacterium]